MFQGPSAVGIDVSFPQARHAYGLASHPAGLDLPSFDSPYRFFNTDAFGFKHNSPVSTYGAVQLLTVKHEPQQPPNDPKTKFSPGSPPAQPSEASAFFWLNPSETYVKLDRYEPSCSGEEECEGAEVRTWWVSETGILDAVVFPGPTPADVLHAYHVMTGPPSVPPLFAIGKHQCRSFVRFT